MHHFSKLTILFVFVLLGQASAQNLSYGIELDPSYHLREGGQLNFAAGGFVSLDISDQFMLSTGVKIGSQHLSDKIDIIGWLEDFRYGTYMSYEVEHNASYLGLPLQARYKLRDKENHFYVNYNFTYWFRLSARSQLILGTEAMDQLQRETIHERRGISNIIGFGYEFRLKERLSIYIEPRFSLSHYLKNGRIDSFYYLISYDSRQIDLGISAGLRFK